ncbi:MAG TPA: hypothetical protein VE934_05360 [Polaromonas sp.]|uniref:hypothetical protein n=1 Tax=Polaromonas sp. TaxID=1869339 RepID=UPI002D578A40|nr:hypothetical protein [Polaromonas sp.]HYW56363.1 hypothetical protein [Polaromonas sp.]
MMRSTHIRRAVALLGTAALLLGVATSPAVAGSNKSKKTKTPSQAKSVKFIPGSQESPKDRATRLKRECKGGVNAGACTGYTR